LRMAFAFSLIGAKSSCNQRRTRLEGRGKQ